MATVVRMAVRVCVCVVAMYRTTVAQGLHKGVQVFKPRARTHARIRTHVYAHIRAKHTAHTSLH